MGEEWDIEKAVVRACKAAAMVVSTLTAQEGIPWADEIDGFVGQSDAAAEAAPEIETGVNDLKL
jgi:sugar/nucleoside kinase (ribokinase family)